MKQVVQNFENGQTYLADVPAPAGDRNSLIIATTASLISPGTERMLVDFGRASLINKVRKQPDKVKAVLAKVRTDGLLQTVSAVKSKLAQPIPLGYCNVGKVVAAGAAAGDFKPGDRVVSNGAHAEVVRVPHTLCARIPDGVSDETAAFTVLAAIGLQGMRLLEPRLGESVAVIGAGLIGLLTIQMLLANGCRVLAIDFDEAKLHLARSYGAEICNVAGGADPVAAGLAFSRHHGVDGVIIAASTASSDPITQAARMSRKRGRIIMVGVTGMELNRADFYEKELSFQVSCSYGPGRYDPAYEGQGQDYPYAFVRWTEQRNFEAVLDLMAAGRLDVSALVSRRVDIGEAAAAYDDLASGKAGLGILLTYGAPLAERLKQTMPLAGGGVQRADKPVLGVIGAGNYATRMLLPAFKAAGAQFNALAATTGLNPVVHGDKAGFAEATTDIARVLADPATTAVVIATRHGSHASLAAQALAAGKHVFVEKPLAVDREGLATVKAAWSTSPGDGLQLMVGFNRRYAPQVLKMKALLAAVPGPKSFILTMNAGAIPAGHWTQDTGQGGGRIVGEACHHIDLARFLAGSPITRVEAQSLKSGNAGQAHDDTASITLGFADGSLATIHYFANGSAQFSKERIEAFAAGSILQLDNFRTLRGFGWKGFSKMALWQQDKGQTACAAAFLAAVSSGRPAIPRDEILEVAEVTLKAAELLQVS